MADKIVSPLLQLRVLGLGFFQDRNVGVGVFPEGEEIFVGGEGASVGEIGIRSLPLPLKHFRLQRIGTGHAQVRQRSGLAVPDDAVWVKCVNDRAYRALSTSELMGINRGRAKFCVQMCAGLGS
jgi:hypothetical protein